MRDDSGVRLRKHRAQSWLNAAEQPTLDLDEKFIFHWIALNALYGQAKYRWRDPGSEESDLRKFLKLMERLEKDRVRTALKLERPNVDRLLQNPFLDDGCWMLWDKETIRDRVKRREACIPERDRESDLLEVLKRIYVLRKQVFHGCSTKGGHPNRESLRAAVPVLARLVPIFRDIVGEHGRSEPFVNDLPPYPPSTSNTPPFHTPVVVGSGKSRPR